MSVALKMSEAAALAIHSVALLARRAPEDPMNISEISEALAASRNHLGKVLHRLVRSGLVVSVRGPKGGFCLDPRAKRKTLMEVYEIFDGPLGDEDCVLGRSRKDCPCGGCIFGDYFQTVREGFRRKLKLKVGSLCSPPSPGVKRKKRRS